MGRARFFTGEFSAAERSRLRGMLATVEAVQVDYSPAQVAAMIGLRVRAVLDLVQSGEFPGSYKPAHNRVRIPAEAVRAFKERRRIFSEAESEGGR